MKKNLAAIDIGTNSIHLAVVRFDPHFKKFKIIDREKETVRLGTGSTDMKYLSDEAVERAINVLKRYKQIADAHGAYLRAVCTSAVREALNRNEFISLVKAETGIAPEIISGFEEARLIYMGMLQSLPVSEKRTLLVDIGGGSTEFLVGEGHETLYSNSLKLGAVRLTQRFFDDGKLTSKSVKKCRKYIAGMLSPVVREIKRFGFELAIGTSGTIMNTAQAVMARQRKISPEKMNGAEFTARELNKIVGKILKAKTPEHIAGIKGIDKDRADIIAAGALILEQVFREARVRKMTVSDFALREGVLLDTIEKKHRIRSHDYINNARMNSVMNLSGSFNLDAEHGAQTAKLALRLFDETEDVHGLGPESRELLQYAAILHDTGMFLSHAQHHRHTYYIIRNAELPGFTENDKEIIANIARYHRKSHPKDKHDAFRELDEQDKEVVMKLAALLRVADGLDRSHSSLVDDISCRIRKKKVTCYLKPRFKSNPALEVWGAQRKKQLFEAEFGRKLELRVR